ncbi:25019_t:CDS:2, partial [Racocetra persica]
IKTKPKQLCLYNNVLSMTKKVTRGQIPGMIITDGDPAIKRAITIEYPITRGFMVTMFTLEIETTSFVENENVCIKYLLESSNMSFYDLRKVFMNCVEDKASEKQYEELISISVLLTINCVTIFLAIESIGTYYLRLKVAQYIIGQMKKCVYYTAYLSNIEEIEHITTDKPSESKRFEDELEAAWFSMKLINIHWIPQSKRSDALNEYECFEQRFSDNKQVNYFELPFSTYNIDVQDNFDNQFVKEQLFYRKIWSLVCTATDKCLLYQDYGFIQVVENYLDEVCKHKEELTQASAINLNDSNKENTYSSIQLRNLLKVIIKG